jgi:hypothetical protein
VVVCAGYIKVRRSDKVTLIFCLVSQNASSSIIAHVVHTDLIVGNVNPLNLRTACSTIETNPPANPHISNIVSTTLLNLFPLALVCKFTIAVCAIPHINAQIFFQRLQPPRRIRLIDQSRNPIGPHWAPDHTVETALARYWTSPNIKGGRHRQVSAPVAVFARLVLVLVDEIMPMGNWSMSRFVDSSPGWEDFDGPKVCPDFASCAELRETAIDLLLGRDTTKRRTDPVFHELLHPPDFACFQPLPHVNLKLAHWLQEWETRFWQWQCEAASKFGFCRMPTPMIFAPSCGSGSSSRTRGGVTDTYRLHMIIFS